MKIKIRFIAVVLIAFALTLISCDTTGGVETPIEITAKQENITLMVDEVLDYDYTQLFTITSGTSDIEVLEEYLDLSNLKAEVGTYFVMCTYKNKMVSINVKVVKKTTVNIDLTTNDEIVVNSLTVFTHNYKQYFKITDDTTIIEVKDENLDLSSLRTTAGSYKITCSYYGVTKELFVKVEEINYQIKIDTREITIKQSQVENYNFNQHFTVVIDGKIQTITDDMIESNVLQDVGTYEYKVSLGETSVTLIVKVISDYDIEIINSYNLKEIEIDEINTFDYTTLFSVYLDGEVRKVTLDMIDKSSLNNLTENEIYEIYITYQEGQAICNSKCLVKVVPASQIVITPKNMVIYPNSGYIDLTSLFTITKKGQSIPVTLDMIEGTINYTEIGLNTIKLTYQGQEAIAEVEVKQGVIINYTKADVIQISKGTSKENYNFAADFSVLVNGIKFTNISSYINTDNVDFNTIGTYTATISVPYTDSSLNIDKGTLFTKEITYEVVKSIYNIRVLNETVILSEGTNTFDAFSNLSVKINGVNQKLTKIASQASTLATYAQALNEVDFSKIGLQEIGVDVYVNGPEAEPVRVTFNVLIESDIEINVNKTFVFEGETVYTKDIFTLTLNGENIEITQDMIEGKIDTSTPGVYPVTISYQGINEKIDFIVLNLKMVGTYNTLLTTIPTESSSDEDGYEEAGTAAAPLKKLFITADGQISVNGSLAEILYGIDENTMYIEFNNYEFTLSYNNGIVFIDPNNNLKMGFIEEKRPLLYFNEDLWELNERVVINSTDQHILQLNYNAYSFDIFNITNKITNETMWYALKINLYERISSDIKYIVNHGEVKFDESFTMETGINSKFNYLNDEYKFTMTSENVGKIDSNETVALYKYADKTFITVIDGQTAVLKVDAYEGFSLKIGDKVIFSASGASIRNQKYGGIDYNEDIVHILYKGSNTESPYSYKLHLNLDDNSFTVFDKDMYYGRYESENIYIFLDGYGTGLINFNKKQYGETLFVYETIGNLINITYKNITPSFEFGTEASLYIDEFNNTLTPKYFAKEELCDEVLINNYLTDGALVNIASYELELYANVVLVKKAFFDNITITTKDGVITDNARKKELVDITNIDFLTKGIYHFSITVEVNGKDVVMHYAVQII